MSDIIGADAAKLAGLQIDTLQKFRAGQITFDQWERFNNLSPGDRALRFGETQKPKAAPEPTEKFALLADLGIITVPVDYYHVTWLATFRARNYKKFTGYNDALTDANFSNPSRILRPGDRLRVRVFQQIVQGTTTSEERMAYLVMQNAAVYTGVQGAALVFDQKRDQLPKGKWYASFDEKERLFEDAFGYHRVPRVGAYADVRFEFDLGFFESVWPGVNALIGFCDVE